MRIDTVSPLKDLPPGILAPLWLQVTKTVPSPQASYLEVEDRFGTKIRILFTPASQGRQFPWKQGEWYQFKNLVHAPSITQRYPECQDCATELVAAQDTIQEAVSLTRGLTGGPQFVGTTALQVNKLGAGGWLTPSEGLDIDPIRWTCPSCGGIQVAAYDSTAEVTETSRSETLTDRINSALHDLSPSDSAADDDADAQLSTAESFRSQILAGEQPSVKDVTHDAVFSDYEFRPTVSDPTLISSLAPAVSRAISTNPITDRSERFCTISVNPRAFDWSRGRPTLELVLVIDVSGSMAAPFETGTSEASSQPSKLETVRNSLADVIQRLSPTDRLGVVLFDTDAKVVKPLGPVDAITHQQFCNALADSDPAGNTNPMEGLRHAGRLFDTASNSGADTERRILLVSDTVPTVSASSTQQYIERCRSYQRRGVGTTFVGLGFSATSAARELCRVPGSNISFVESAAELTELSRRHLDSLLFPVAFDFTMDTNENTEITDLAAPSDPPNVESVFHRTTVFPSGPTLQSLPNLLLQLSTDTEQATFHITWRDRADELHETTLSVDYTERQAEWFESDEIRTSIALHRYLRTLQEWCCEHIAAVDMDGQPAIHGSSDDIVTQLESLKTYLLNQRRDLDTHSFEADIDVLSTLVSNNADK